MQRIQIPEIEAIPDFRTRIERLMQESKGRSDLIQAASDTSQQVSKSTKRGCSEGCSDGWIEYIDDDGVKRVKECKCSISRRALELFERSGISRYGFKDFIVYDERIKTAKEAAIKYTKDFINIRYTKNNSISITGQPGSGKTHLASAISNNLMAAGVPVIYALYTELIPKLKQSYMDAEDYNREIGRLKNATVLFIDDLYKEFNETDKKYVFDIVDYRYRKCLPLIISSEKTKNDLLNIDEATGRRILEMSKNYMVELLGQELNYSLR